MDDPLRAAGDREGVRNDRWHAFAECLSQMDEFRTDIRGDGVDLLRKFSDQTGKKRGRVFRRSFSHLPISVFGDLLDGEEDRNAEDVAGTERTTLRTPRNSGRLSWLFRITLMSISSSTSIKHGKCL